jgi:cytidylate kinase
MGTVTIAATYGAGGSVVARAVAERLSLPLVDRALPVALAHELAAPLQGALAEDERRRPGLVGRALACVIDMSGLYVGAPLPLREPGADDRVAATEEALRQSACRGGAVVLGRAGVFVLRGRADTLHVRLDGPASARQRQAMRHEELDEATAALQRRETDRARAAYVSHFYPGERWDDPANYHLVIDSTAIPLDACVELVVVAANQLFAAGLREAAASPTTSSG